MTQAPEMTQVTRPAEDIAEDITALVRRFSPLWQSRHWFTYTVQDGVVTVQGNIKSSVGHRVLLDNVPHIPGVVRLDSSGLFNDEDLRLQIGRVMPAGVLVNVNFGRVVISGRLPNGQSADALIARIEQLDGVRRVDSRLWA